MTSSDLLGLLGSRICHDIISPLGAIGNGVELLSLSSSAPTEELALVNDSVVNATAKVRLFRLAFGGADHGQTVPLQEVRSALDGITDGRLLYDWQADDPAGRRDVRAALLAMLCVERALPLGGTVEVVQKGSGWSITGRGERVAPDPPLWSALANGVEPEVEGATIQFALLPMVLTEDGKRPDVAFGDGWIAIRF